MKECFYIFNYAQYGNTCSHQFKTFMLSIKGCAKIIGEEMFFLLNAHSSYSPCNAYFPKVISREMQPGYKNITMIPKIKSSLVAGVNFNLFLI